jgi:protein-tyrosine phosphatase
MVDTNGFDGSISVDSAGTGDWHIGRSPDQRTAAVAKTKGYDLSELRARLVTGDDFAQFDYVIAMDKANLSDLKAMCPDNYTGHLGLFLDFTEQQAQREVPDPYYGGDNGFELVFNLVEEASCGLLKHIQAEHSLKPTFQGRPESRSS